MRNLLSNQMKSMLTVAACMLLCCGDSHGHGQDSGSSSDPRDQAVKADSEDLDNRLLEGIENSESKRRAASPDKSEPERRAVEDAGGREGGPVEEGSDIVERNVLVQIGRQMQRVENLLSQRKVSAETQRNQREIVSQLDQLIAALSAFQQAEQQREMEPDSKTDEDGQKVAKTGKKPARNSSGKPEKTDSPPREPAPLQEMAGEIWGHLPERLRGQVQSVEAVEFLPKYRELIEDYYRRLAEER
ncbi:MAG: hypothetical protein ACODAD_01075 [Planctomycetota bacterium]